MRRVLILILLLVLIGAGAIIALNAVGNGGDGDGDEDVTVVDGTNQAPESVEATPTPIVVPIVLAVLPIERGSVITADMVDVRLWPELDEQLADPTYLNRLFTAEEDIVGLVARTDIPRFSPVADTMVAEVSPISPLELSPSGSDLALGIDPDRLTISVPLDPTGIGQVAYALQPGDRVDIIMTFAFVDVDEFFQTRVPNTVAVLATAAEGELTFTNPQAGNPEPNLFILDIFGEKVDGSFGLVGQQRAPGVIGPSETIQRPRLVSQRVIEDAEVMFVGWLPEDGRIYGVSTPTPFIDEGELIQPTDEDTGAPAQPAPQQGTVFPTVTPTPFTPVIMNLALSPQDAVTLLWAIDSNVQVHYALRSANVDAGAPVGGQTTAVSLDYMITNPEFGLPNPNQLRFTYALEPRPALRSFDLSTLRRFVELQPELYTQVSAEISAQQANDPIRRDLLREILFAEASAAAASE